MIIQTIIYGKTLYRKTFHSFVVCDATGEVTLEDGPEASRLAETHFPSFPSSPTCWAMPWAWAARAPCSSLAKSTQTLCQAKGDHFYGAVFEGSQVRGSDDFP